jgi:hypothetical protein
MKNTQTRSYIKIIPLFFSILLPALTGSGQSSLGQWNAMYSSTSTKVCYDEGVPVAELTVSINGYKIPDTNANKDWYLLSVTVQDQVNLSGPYQQDNNFLFDVGNVGWYMTQRAIYIETNGFENYESLVDWAPTGTVGGEESSFTIGVGASLGSEGVGVEADAGYTTTEVDPDVTITDYSDPLNQECCWSEKFTCPDGSYSIFPSDTTWPTQTSMAGFSFTYDAIYCTTNIQEGVNLSVSASADVELDQDTNGAYIFNIVYPYIFVPVHLWSDPPPNQPQAPTLPAWVWINSSFQASTADSDPSGNPLTYQFTWGDGAASDWGGATNFHVYTNGGTYNIYANAEDYLPAISSNSPFSTINVVQLNQLDITGPLTVSAASGGQYLCNGYYNYYDWVSNFTDQASWTISPSNCGTISSSGLLTVPYVTQPVNLAVTATYTDHGIIVSGSDSQVTVLPVYAQIVGESVPYGAGTVYVSGSAFQNGEYAVTSQVTLTASAGIGYVFTGWSDGDTNNPRTITVPAGGATYTGNFQAAATISVLASPPNGGTVSGGGYFAIGSQQQIFAIPSTNWTFTGWADGITTNPRTITVPSNGATYTADFEAPGTITVLASPPNGGTVSGGGSFVVGSQQQISASTNAGWAFTGWSDGVTQNPRTVTVTAGTTTYTADFTVVYSVVVQTSPAGPSFAVDGINYSAAQSFTWLSGSQHTMSTAATQSGGTGVQCIWTNWSDNGAITHTVFATNSQTYTANFITQYYLTMAAGTGGTVTPSSEWTTSGAVVAINAIPNNGYYSFTNWSGSGTGSYSGNGSSASVTMSGPIAETAIFSANVAGTGPQIVNVDLVSRDMIISGWGFGNMARMPSSGMSPYLSIVDYQLIEFGPYDEWGYTGDYYTLRYISWTDTQIELSGFPASPGDAVTIALWNPATGAGATWGGNVPGGSGMPQISSVTFAGSGTNMQVCILGSGFGGAPTNLPFTGVLNQFIFQDHFTHSPGPGSFEAGATDWGYNTPDSVTLNYQSWTDGQITLNGFGGAYGQGINNTLQNGDPVTIVIWNTTDADQTGPQTAWAGFVSALPLLGTGNPPWDASGFHLAVYAPAGSNVVVQASADLANWVSVYTNAGSFSYTDTGATNGSGQFYRAVIP